MATSAGRLRVTVTIDAEPAVAGGDAAGAEVEALALGGGRHLPALLFVTQPEALGVNIGVAEAKTVLEALRASGALVELSPDETSPKSAVEAVLARLTHGGFEGIVLVGGYDVVPSLRLDVLPPSLRAAVTGDDDADDFIVWSDDAYGDTDGDTMAELPVTRVPDGHSAALLFRALSASAHAQPSERFGIRNVARPFAEQVYSRLRGAGELRVSEPTVATTLGPAAAGGDVVYLMLHGDWVDSSRFWGEDTPGNEEAVNIGSLPNPCGAVVFTGCCWGALTVDQPAGRVTEGRAIGVKSETASMALSFLSRGALAFVGCTGSHYSPTVQPYGYFGQPLHEAFFAFLQNGLAPAQALFEAKKAYAVGMPHGQAGSVAEAIELKILRQYTSLGLGW